MVPRPRNGLSLCAGGGGLDLGLGLAEPDFHTRAYVEWEPYPRSILIAAQQAGYLAPAPIWDDLTTFDAKPFAGAIDTLLAGYPCQPFSQAGQRKGEADDRHLWPHVARIARELGDALNWIFLENVSGHVTLGGEAVLRTLRDMGFTPAAGLFTAEEVGTSHERLRLFIVAYRPCRGQRKRGDAAQQGGSRHADSGDSELANSYGRDASAEREQRGGEQRFQPEGGGVGGKPLDDTIGNGRESGRDRHHGGHERVEPDTEGQSMAQPAGEGLSQRRHGGQPEASAQASAGLVAEPERCGGVGELADTGGAGSQGQQPGQRDAQGWQEPHGFAGLRGRAGLFPPGPADRDAWAAIMAADPSFAPSFARRDAASAALNLAALFDPDTAETIERLSGGISGQGELAALVGQEVALVDQAQALSRFCRVADGLAERTRALKLLGNGVCPLAAAYAWRTLSAAHGLGRLDMGAAGESAAGDADGFFWGMK